LSWPDAEGGTLRVTFTRSPPSLAINGEIDETAYEDLVAALDALRYCPGEIHVGLAGVEYCDLAGLRAILSLTGVNGQGSRRVTLHDVPPHLIEVLRILGWDATPGLTLDDGPGQLATQGGGLPAPQDCVPDRGGHLEARRPHLSGTALFPGRRSLRRRPNR
jgi:ABC-type transporter Mla MlaB component